MNSWDTMLPALVKEFNEHPRDFLRQPTFRLALHPNQQKVADVYFPVVKQGGWVDLTRLRHPEHGHPFRYDKFKQASPLCVQHAYYLHLIGHHFGGIQHYRVSEIGGGYGNFRRIIAQQGHETEHTIFDFKQMHEIQKRFLTDGDTMYSALTPAKLKSAGGTNTLLVATFSVSEMPMAQRLKLEPAYRAYDRLFFAYNREFDGVDNFKYFAELGERLTGYKVTLIDDPPRRARFMLAERV